MRAFLIFVLVSLVFASTVSAATINGYVYDIDLNKVDDVEVRIDTKPEQKDTTDNGYYSFALNPGTYNLKATYRVNGKLVSTAEERLNIPEQGNYVLDLLLFPSLEEETGLIEETGDGEISVDKTNLPWVIVGAAFIIILILSILLFKYRKSYKLFNKSNKEEEKEETDEGISIDVPVEVVNNEIEVSIGDDSDEDTIGDEEKLEKEKDVSFDTLPNDIIEFIKKNEGRVTQKDIRKEFPSSEAKISLVITELVDSGKIKKIKKGRGNIIVLKQD